jgi:uncharacterized membrane protein
MNRIKSIDVLRGLVMIFMTIDHCRDLTGTEFFTNNPTDLKTTTAALFFTRWITHLCAPTFVFLSGVSAYLLAQRRNDANATRNFLIKRGVVLVIINFTLTNFGIFLDIRFGVLFFQVIAAIGFALIGLGLMIKLPVKTIGIIGLVIIFGHNLFDTVNLSAHPALNVIWTIFMSNGFFPITEKNALLVSYPIIPWLGVAMAGFAFGKFFNRAIEERKKIFVRIGLITIALFILIRALNFYGDPSPWSMQKSGSFTFLSFINTTKYPPSLLFVLMTLGISVLILSFIDGIQNKLMNIISTYGKAPLFYWLLHWYVVHFIAIIIFTSQGFHLHDLQFNGFGMGRPEKGGGLDLPGLYLLWISVVIILYPVCKWFGTYKEKHREINWLHYL